MNIETKRAEPKFSPIEIKIVIENQDELDRWTSLIGNWSNPYVEVAKLYGDLTRFGGIYKPRHNN